MSARWRPPVFRRPGRKASPRRVEVASVTDAAEGLSTEMRGRQRQYLTMMAIRIVCLPLAIVFDGWLRWVFIVAAMVLPYVAVVLANATRRDPARGPEPVRLPHMYELPPVDTQKDRIGSP